MNNPSDTSLQQGQQITGAIRDGSGRRECLEPVTRLIAKSRGGSCLTANVGEIMGLGLGYRSFLFPQISN